MTLLAKEISLRLEQIYNIEFTDSLAKVTVHLKSPDHEIEIKMSVEEAQALVENLQTAINRAKE